MQVRACVLLCQLYHRNKGSSESHDDFFTFVDKKVAEAASSDTYRGILKAEMGGLGQLTQGTISQLLAATNEFKLKSIQGQEELLESYFSDLQHTAFYQQLITNAESSRDPKIVSASVVLLLRSALMRGDAFALLQAANLVMKKRVDVLNEVQHLCSISERCSDAAALTTNFTKTDDTTLQDKVEHGYSDYTALSDRIVAIDDHWFIWRGDRGFSKGKKGKDGDWDCELTVTEDVLFEKATMFTMEGKLYMRHAGALDHPFVEIDQETLKVKPQQVIYTGDRGKPMPLKWTTASVEISSSSDEAQGNRFMQQTPLFYDGEFLYALAPYRKSDAESDVVHYHLETYSIQGTTISLQTEVALKTDEFDKEEINKLTEHCILVCNDSTCLIADRNSVMVIDKNSGEVKQNLMAGSDLIQTYCAKDNRFYHMDAAVYGWLKWYEIKGFKPKIVDVGGANKLSNLPALPIIYDSIKGDFIRQKKERDSQLKESAAGEIEIQPYSLFQRLIKGRAEQQTCNTMAADPPKGQSPFTKHREAKAVIISMMGVTAHQTLKQIKVMGARKLKNEELLKYFKVPFAVQLREEYLVALRTMLTESVESVMSGQRSNTTTIDIMELLNLLKIYHANFHCLIRCRIDFQVLLGETERSQIKNELVRTIEKLKALPVSADSVDMQAEIPQDKIIMLHIKRLAAEVVLFIETELDNQSSLSKLQNLELRLQQLTVTPGVQQQANDLQVGKALVLMSTQSALKDIFESGDLQTVLNSKRVLTQTLVLINNHVAAQLDNALKSKDFTNKQLLGTDSIYVALVGYARNFCTELSFVFGKQIIIIAKLEGVEGITNPSKEEKAKQQTLRQAREAKRVLESIIYDTFIMVSVYFKEQVFAVTQQLWYSNIQKWSREEDVRGFLTLLKEINDTENSITRIVMHFCLTMCSYTPKVTWLDEIAEALKNCSNALTHFITMCNCFTVESKVREMNSALPYMQFVYRYVNYAIGNVACQLINRDFREEASDLDGLKKLNILQGGIETRFIPSLTLEARQQIEGSFKITHDELLKDLALKNPEQIVLIDDDVLLNAIVDKNGNFGQVEVALSLLQEALQTKRPMVSHSRLGGDAGFQLTRAAFAVILKFSNKTSDFVTLSNKINSAGDSINTAQGNRVAQLKSLLENDCPQLLKKLEQKWEQASQMRKWTQFVKLQISESLKKRVTEELESQIKEQNPSADFKGKLTDQQKEEIERRFNAQFDTEIAKTYAQVYEKARFLIKLQVPKAFIDAEKTLRQDNVKKSVNTKLAGGLNSMFQRKNSVLLSQSTVGRKDTEVDWRDSLRKWRAVQLSSGAVNTLSEKNQSVFKSCTVSVLGCLQASFTAAQLKRKVEESLINGLRRAAGMHLMQFAMKQTHSKKALMDMVQWFMGSLRRNQPQVVHFMDGLEGCGVQAEEGIRSQFFAILERLIFELKDQSLIGKDGKFDYTEKHSFFLLDAICLWDYKLSDHEHLAELDFFSVVSNPTLRPDNPITQRFGQKLDYELTKDAAEKADERYLQALQFLPKVILASLIVDDASKVDTGAELALQKMDQVKHAFNRKASQALVSQVLTFLMRNIKRYVVCMSGARNNQYVRDEAMAENTGEKIDKNSRFLFDVAIHRKFDQCPNKKVTLGVQLLNEYLRRTKVDRFVEKVTSEEITPNSSLFTTLGKLLNDDVGYTIGRVVQRNIEALEAIEKMSWQELGLEEPKIGDFSEEKLSAIIQVPAKEWQEFISKDSPEDLTVLPKSEARLTIEQCQVKFDFIKKVEQTEHFYPELANYDETTILAMIDILDHYLALAEGDSAIYFAAETICEPQNLSLLIQLSVEGSYQVQFKAHKILQNILRFDVPVQVLNQAVKVATSTRLVPHHLGNRSEVARLLKLETSLVFEGGEFLQLFFNQLFEVRKGVYLQGNMSEKYLASVVDEAVRTIRVAALEPHKNTLMKEIFDKTIKEAILGRMETMSQLEMDALWTLVPEAQFERVAAGTPCLDNSGKRFTVANFSDGNKDQNENGEIKMSSSDELHVIQAVSYSADRPDQQDLIEEKLYQVRTLIDLDQSQAIKAAHGSILKDPEVVKKLISLLKPEAQAASKNKGAQLMLKTFVLRGIFAIMGAIPTEYTAFLRNLGVIDDLREFLVRECRRNVDDLHDLFGRSATHLELRLDEIRTEVISVDNKQGEQTQQILFASNSQAKLVLKTKPALEASLEESIVKEISFDFKSYGKDVKVDSRVDVALSPSLLLLNQIKSGQKAYIYPSEQLTDEFITTIATLGQNADCTYIIMEEKVDNAALLELLLRAKSKQIARMQNFNELTFLEINNDSFKEIVEALRAPIETNVEPKLGEESKNGLMEIPNPLPNMSIKLTADSEMDELLGERRQKVSEEDKHAQFLTKIQDTVFVRESGRESSKLMFCIMRKLCHTYAHKLLIDLLATSDKEVNSFSEEVVQSIFTLLHNDFKTAAEIEKSFGQSHPVIDSKEKIREVLKILKENEKIRSGFIQDFYKRAYYVVKEKAGQTELTFESKALHSFNLLYFQREINDLNFITEPAKKVEWLKNLFLLNLSYAVIADTFDEREKLMQVASITLKTIAKNLEEFLKDENTVKGLFSSELLEKLMSKLSEMVERDYGQRINTLNIDLIANLIKIKKKAEKLFKRDLKMPIEITDKLKSLIESVTVVQQGTKFKEFIPELKVKVMAETMDCSAAVRHLTEVFQTDVNSFEIPHWECSLTATDYDMEFVPESCPSGQVLRIESESGVAWVSEEDLNTIQVAKGQKIKFQYPVDYSSVTLSGKLSCRNKTYLNFENQNWAQFPNTVNLGASEVYSCHHAILLRAGAKLYGSNQSRSESETKLTELELPPECSKIRKIVQNKYFRLILDEAGELYANGQNKAQTFGNQCSRYMYATENFFYPLKNLFPNVDNYDKTIDVAGGKTCMAIVTQKGNLYANGYQLHRRIDSSIKEQQRGEGEDDSFRVLLPEGHKALQVWIGQSTFSMWVTCEKADGQKVTLQLHRSDQEETITAYRVCEHPMEDKTLVSVQLSGGGHFTQISNYKKLVCGVDESNNLWIWGKDLFASNSLSHDFFEDYDEAKAFNLRMYKVKWFKNQSLKVVKALAGNDHIVVQTLNKDGKTAFYGISGARGEDDAKVFGDVVGCSVFHDNVFKLKVGEGMTDFAVTRESTIFLKPVEAKKRPSINPDLPNEQGLVHFYKAGDTWKFVSASTYESKKTTLPEICFATKASIEDLQKKEFPDLQSIIQQMAPIDQHSVQSSMTGANLAPSEPIWVSHTTISGQTSRIYLSQAEVFTQAKLDLNPLIYFRVNKPIKGALLDKLPCLDLDKYFKRSGGLLKFSFNRKEITYSDISAVQSKSTPAVNQYIKEATRELREEEMTELLAVIDKQVMSQVSIEEITELCESKILLKHAMFRESSTLRQISERAINIRTSFLLKFMKAWLKILEFVDNDDCSGEENLSFLHRKNSRLIMKSIMNKLFEEGLKEKLSDSYGEPRVDLSRRKALMFKDSGLVDNAGTSTVFGQAITSLEEQGMGKFQNFRKKDVSQKFMYTTFLGEGGIDAGGLFRDALVDISKELESSTLPLLIKTPNNKNDHGNNRESYILNGLSGSPRHLQMFRFFGAMLSFSILSLQPLSINLAPFFWKQLVGQEQMTLQDLDTIDSYSFQQLNNLRSYSGYLTDEDFEASIDQYFTTILSDGSEVSLCPNGTEKKVTKQNLDEFVQLVLKARSAEAKEQMDAVKDGINTTMEGHFNMLSYLSWGTLEARACGEKIFDVKKLKSITSYPDCAQSHPIVGRFWRVFEAYTEEEKSQYLKFVWGRTRLPIDCSNLDYKHQVRLKTDLSARGFPLSHTCFFQLDIPNYANDEICRERLTQAAALCGQIDCDNNDVADEAE